MILCGFGCAGAHDELLAQVEKLQAPMAHALRGEEHAEWDNPYEGTTGLIRLSSSYHAMLHRDVLSMARTDFPYHQFYPKGSGVHIAQIDLRAEQIERRTPVDLGPCAPPVAPPRCVVGDIHTTISALVPLPERQRNCPAEMAKGFSLFMAEVVLSGRANEKSPPWLGPNCGGSESEGIRKGTDHDP